MRDVKPTLNRQNNVFKSTATYGFYFYQVGASIMAPALI